METQVIPVNEEGKENDLFFSQTFKSEETARAYFIKACERLLLPQLWHELTGALSANFKTYSSSKAEKKNKVAKGDFIRIDIPGLGNNKGKGYDWVKVAALIDGSNSSEEESFAMKLQPCSNPFSKDDSTAHFFSEKASSTFLIHREKNTITVSYHGRNETANSDTDSALDNVRNTIVAAGARMGLSEMQWSALIKSFLAD